VYNGIIFKKKTKEKGMACFSTLSPWLVGFGNEDPK